MKKYTLIATAPMGIEAVVAKEVRELGYECQVDNGKVIFEGDALAICRANLWLRTADRVKVQVAEFQAKTFDELFEKQKRLTGVRLFPRTANSLSSESPLSQPSRVCLTVSESLKKPLWKS